MKEKQIKPAEWLFSLLLASRFWPPANPALANHLGVLQSKTGGQRLPRLPVAVNLPLYGPGRRFMESFSRPRDETPAPSGGEVPHKTPGEAALPAVAVANGW